MLKHRLSCFILTVSIISCYSSRAKDTTIQERCSPTFRQFLSAHPAALQSLTNAMLEAFGQRTRSLFYFYSDDETMPRSYHDFPNESKVSIYVRENQEPVDEFICLIFDAQNAANDKRYSDLFDKARTGAISKNDFAREMSQLELDAIKQTRDILNKIAIGASEGRKSDYCKLFEDTPDDLDKFLVYNKKLTPSRNIFKELEAKYDFLRKDQDKR
jgi:hypothetical protein